MKVSCPRPSLLAACQAILPALASRTTKPILSCVKITAAGTDLALVGHDLEIGIRYTVAHVEAQRSGSVVIDAAKLVQILRECEGAEVSIVSDRDSVAVAIDSSRFELSSHAVDEFPDLPAVAEAGAPFEIDAAELHRLIRHTAFASDKKDSTRFALSGLLFEADGKVIRLVGTDSKRLAVCEGPSIVTGDINPKASHIIPAKALALIERLGEGVVRIAVKPNEMMFETEHVMVYTRLLEGRYPPWRDIFKAMGKPSAKIALAPAAFSGKVRQAAIMTDRESSRVDLTFESGAVTMKARGAETGASEVKLALPDFDGATIETAFDPRYVVEFLRTLDGDAAITLELTSGDKPALFRHQASYRYLVMPLVG